jgi:hypothetical protein
MSIKYIKVFISHSWTYDKHYQTLRGWIFEESWRVNDYPLVFQDCSIPKDNPIHNAPNEEALRNEIFKYINTSHIVLIPAGMYANHSRWMKKELDGSRLLGKPVLSISPWGQEREPRYIENYASNSVGWNKKSVVDAIWKEVSRKYSL